MMYILQSSRMGAEWKNEVTYPDWRLAIARFDSGAVSDDLDGEYKYDEGKRDFRIIDTDGKVYAHWIALPYVGSPYINLLGDNPLQKLFDEYNLTDTECHDIVQKWLTAKDE